jgi:hypothetical protein
MMLVPIEASIVATSTIRGRQWGRRYRNNRIWLLFSINMFPN